MRRCSALIFFQQFEEYISGALASIKHADFIAKGKENDVVIAEGQLDLLLCHSSQLRDSISTLLRRRRKQHLNAGL